MPTSNLLFHLLFSRSEKQFGITENMGTRQEKQGIEEIFLSVGLEKYISPARIRPEKSLSLSV